MTLNIEFDNATLERMNAVKESIRNGMSVKDMIDLYGFVETWDCLIVLTHKEQEIEEMLTFYEDWHIHLMEECLEDYLGAQDAYPEEKE